MSPVATQVATRVYRGARSAFRARPDVRRISFRNVCPRSAIQPAPEPTLTISTSTTINTSDDATCVGGIVAQPAGPAICVLYFGSITLERFSVLRVVGLRALALVSDGPLVLDGDLDISANGSNDGPGGGGPRSILESVAPNGGGGAGFKTAGGAGGSATLDGGALNGGAAEPDPIKPRHPRRWDARREPRHDAERRRWSCNLGFMSGIGGRARPGRRWWRRRFRRRRRHSWHQSPCSRRWIRRLRRVPRARGRDQRTTVRERRRRWFWHTHEWKRIHIWRGCIQIGLRRSGWRPSSRWWWWWWHRGPRRSVTRQWRSANRHRPSDRWRRRWQRRVLSDPHATWCGSGAGPS